MRDYLRGRPSLMRVFVLVDGRRGPKDVDHEMFGSLDRAAVSYQIVLTKHDELTAAERAAVTETTRAALAKHPAAHPEIIFTSSQTGVGVLELRTTVARLMSERGA
jgi:GTP-binding protein